MRKLSQIRAAQTAAIETKPQTTKPASNSPKPKADKKPAKQTAKKETKPREDKAKMDAQYQCLAKFLSEYFDEQAKTDKEFAAKYSTGKKTAIDAAKYLVELHRPANRGPFAGTNNDDDNAIAKLFIMDDSMTIASVKKKDDTPLKENTSQQPKDDADLDLGWHTPDADEQAEADAEYRASKPCNRKPKAAKPSKPTAKKPEPTTFDDGLDDFDF